MGMMRGAALASMVVVAVLAGCDAPSATPEVELFGEGTVSTELPEFAAAFSPDGDTVYFNRTPPDRSRLDLMVSVRVDGAWSDAVPFPPTAGMAAIDPFVAEGGRRLYFSSNAPADGAAPGSFNIWYVDRAGDGWGDPLPLPRPIRSDSSDVFNSVTADGLFVFSSTRDGPRRVYASRLIDGSWQSPVALSFGDVANGGNPLVGPDGSFMVLSLPGASGDPDLFVTCLGDAGWGQPRPLPPPINSGFTEFAPGIGGDRLFFTSERPGLVGAQPDSVRPPGDIYATPLEHVVALCR
ncbi:MAG: hypothetical protein RH859_07915 [Longimicrobiales bacterium]